MTEPGATTAVQKALARRGFVVNRRVGRRLQVVVRRPRQRTEIAGVPGVAQVATAPSAYPDATVVNQGYARTGAGAIADAANGGAGLRIAILDLGFGSAISGLQSRGELPPNVRLTLQSFDPASGLAGTNAYGNPTDHGELVAQTIYDFAPRARYLFVNYHTPDDFVAATDWLTTQKVDIVVHSNNFLEGPFDGTSRAAAAVDRAAAAGILWFNSAGNYGEKVWSGPWNDVDADGSHDWPGATPWTVTHDAGQALTFHLSWVNAPGAPVTDIDLVLEKRRPDGGWDVLARSADRQTAGAAPAERFNGVRPSERATFRLRPELVSGPPPSGSMTLFSREDDLLAINDGRTEGSIPTPSDAEGAISVGGLDWRSNSLLRYSSRGPTRDGRVKPDISAPSGTNIATLSGGIRGIGGTSIAAPNAAGAAAVLISAQRAAGLIPTRAEIRALLLNDAIDLGAPGMDTTFGAGRIRVDVEPPTLIDRSALPRRPLRRSVAFVAEAADADDLATWSLSVDGKRVGVGRIARELISGRVSTRRYPDGPHTVTMEIRDGVGNRSELTWKAVFDNTPPAVSLEVPEIAPLDVPGLGVAEARRARRKVRATVGVTDGISANVSVNARLVDRRGDVRGRARASVTGAPPQTLLVGRVPRGRYILDLVATDAAGNTTRIARRVRIP